MSASRNELTEDPARPAPPHSDRPSDCHSDRSLAERAVDQSTASLHLLLTGDEPPLGVSTMVRAQTHADEICRSGCQPVHASWTLSSPRPSSPPVSRSAPTTGLMAGRPAIIAGWSSPLIPGQRGDFYCGGSRRHSSARRFTSGASDGRSGGGTVPPPRSPPPPGPLAARHGRRRNGGSGCRTLRSPWSAAFRRRLGR